MTNLEFLTKQLEPFSYKERDSIENYLLGILSVNVGARTWAEAVKGAIGYHARTEEYKKAIAPVKENSDARN